MLNPQDISPVQPEEKGEDKNVHQPTRTERLKTFGKEGLQLKNPSTTRVSEETEKVFDEIIARHPEVKIKEGSQSGKKKGYFNCPMAAKAIIDRYDNGGKLVDEAIDILIKAEYHQTGHGICRSELELVTRILALHQKRGKAKAVKALAEILEHHTMRSILVLAKETKLYVQRSEIDMMVLFVESEIAKTDGIRNQFER